MSDTLFFFWCIFYFGIIFITPIFLPGKLLFLAYGKKVFWQCVIVALSFLSYFAVAYLIYWALGTFLPGLVPRIK